MPAEPAVPKRKTLGLIGVGAFGAFILPHLAPYFDLTLCDPKQDLGRLETPRIAVADLKSAASCDIVLLSVPVQRLGEVLSEIAPHLQTRALVLDVASIKLGPTQQMAERLPETVDAVGLHPLFGPQSGKDGIAGLNIAVCNVRGSKAAEVVRFLRDKLHLNVFETTPEDHDRELAWVQGLTHLLAKVIVSLDLPDFRFTTKTYEYMQKMVSMVRHDSDELFRAIEKENPFVAEAKQAFFAAARKLEEELEQR